MRKLTAGLVVAELSEAASTNRLRPGFSAPIEARYRAETLDEQHKYISASWLIGLFLYDSFLLSDFIVDRPSFLMYFIGRICCTTPIALLSIYCIYKKSQLSQLLICIIPFTMAAVLSVSIIYTHGTYRSSYLFGDILLMICGSVIGRTRLPYTVGTIALQCILYMVVLRLSDAIPAESEVVSVLFCLSGGIVAIITSFALEQINRRAFLLSLRVRLLNQELEAMALTDPLTGLANRRCFDEATRRFWANAPAEGAQASFILLDVDRFKLFNDSYGHSAGDLCLQTIGRCVKRAMRNEQDLAVRFGGEELIIFLPNTDFTAARQLAEAMRLAIVAAAIPHPAIALDAVVSASLGAASALTSAITPAELIIRADMALYAAKRNGRNQIWPPLSAPTSLEPRVHSQDAA